MAKYIGIDIGGTKCAVSFGNSDSKKITVFAKSAIESSPDNPQKTLKHLNDVLKKLMNLNGLKEKDFDAIGISCGGIVDSEKCLLVSTPVLPMWRNIDFSKVFSKKLPTFIQNDANACAVAEWLYGAGKGSKNMVFLTCGTGLGAGLILNGALYEGACCTAGEVGHMRIEQIGPVACGKAGSWEGLCSGYGIGELGKYRARELLGSGNTCGYCKNISEIELISAKTLAIAASEGDVDAINVYKKAGDYLGRGIATIIDIINPEAVVIGGVFPRSENLLRPAMEEAIKREAMPLPAKHCKVLKAKLGEKVGDVAAIAVAINGIKNK